MRPFLKPLAWVVLFGLAFLTIRWMVPSEEERIVRLIRDIAERASFTGREGNIARLAAADALAGSFTRDAEIRIDAVVPAVGPLIGRDAIQQVALAARRGTGGVRVSILGAVAEVDSPGAGRVRFTASADTGGGDGTFDAQDFEARVRKEDGKWRVERVEAIPMLRGLTAEIPPVPESE